MLTAALRAAPDVIIVAGDAEPDVVLLDPPAGPSDETGRLTALLHGGRAHVLVLSDHGLDEHVVAALSAGATGFLVRDAHPHTLLEAVRALAGGGTAPDPTIVRRLITEFVHEPTREAAAQLRQLTTREAEVLRLASRGLSNAEIAARLVVSTSTVKTHMNAILGKLKLRDRVQATIFAYEAGLVRPGVN